MELSCVPANTAHLAPFYGIQQNNEMTSCLGKQSSNAATGKFNQQNHQNSLFHALEDISNCSSTTSFFKLKARRKLLSAYLLADALHRLAWRCELNTVVTKFRDIANSKRLNLAYFQVKKGRGIFFVVYCASFSKQGKEKKKQRSMNTAVFLVVFKLLYN